LFSKLLPDNRKQASSEEMWKIIESFGIKREAFRLSNPTDNDVMELYQLIKKRMRDNKDQETIRRLREYSEKLKANLL
jgi:hypothetical protein